MIFFCEEPQRSEGIRVQSQQNIGGRKVKAVKTVLFPLQWLLGRVLGSRVLSSLGRLKGLTPVTPPT